MTETLPLSVTSLIPLIIFPLSGVISASIISEAYVNSIIFLFLGGFLIAIAIESWNLHRRIALKIILFFGTKPSRLLLGFMVASAFLSMWISNTATALMMLPVAFAVVKQFSNYSEDNYNLTKAILLGIAYSCSIGGIATIVGTQPNLVLIRVTKITFPSSPQISFTDWMMLALPISLIILALAFLLIKFLFRLNDDKLNKNNLLNKNYIQEEYVKLGKMSYEEKVVATVFLITISLWIFRTNINLGFIEIIGWASLLNLDNYVDDSTVAIISAFLLFIIPTKNGFSQKRILTISAIEKVPWNVILLFGGGFALASAFTESGLSNMIGTRLSTFKDINLILMILIISITINFLTEFTSNTAVTQMILPVLGSISISLQLHPFLLMIPATLAASMAFMLPVGTPPNTIVFSSNKLKILDMTKTGFLLNIISTIVITLVVYFLGNIIFNLEVFPSWAN
jgi:sodium-dependent dicarboxylate transporter 2/3/5